MPDTITQLVEEVGDAPIFVINFAELYRGKSHCEREAIRKCVRQVALVRPDGTLHVGPDAGFVKEDCGCPCKCHNPYVENESCRMPS